MANNLTNDFTPIRKQCDELAKGLICELFPAYEFREKPAYFVSPFHFDGRPSKKGRTAEKLFIYKNGYTVGENGGAFNCSLYDFFCMVRGLEPTKRESLNTYADAVGFKMPDTAEAREAEANRKAEELKRIQRQTQIQAYIDKRNEILTAPTPEGDTLRAFFASRGWNPEYLDKNLIGYDVETPTHPVTFPIFRNLKAEQIARRALSPEIKPKYKNETGEGKTSFLGFAPPLAKVLYIAEGIPDAIALNNAGFAGACTFSNRINGGQMAEIKQRAKKHGLSAVYLIADDDEAGNSATPENGAKLTAEGLAVHVVTFSDVEGVKDIDDYLNRDHHSPEELAQRLSKAPTFAEYMQQRHRQTFKQDGDINKYFEAVAGLYIQAKADGKTAILNAMESNANEDGYKINVFTEEIAKATTDAPSVRGEASTETTERAERAGGMFQPNGNIWERAGVFSPELETGYILQTMDAPDNAEPWTIPADDLTLICGYTSHGKTKVLQNLFLRMAEDTETKGRFIFVSYEESDGAIIRELINIKTNAQLTEDPRRKTNLEAIGDYLRTGGATQCNGHASEVKTAVEQLETLLTSGRMIVEETNAPAEILADAIRQAVGRYKDDENPIKAVFVDYVQLLEMEHPERLAPNIILKNIALTLHNVAKETQTAIICGAQLKREEKKDTNPVFLSESDIADSAYLERTASEVVVIYDGNRVKGKEYAKLKNGTPDEGQKLLFKKGFANPETGEQLETLEAFGRLYVKICKHRARRAGVEGVLCYTPATGNINNLGADVWASPIWQNTASMWSLNIPTYGDATASNVGAIFNRKKTEKRQTPIFSTPPTQGGQIEGMDGEELPF